LFSRNELTNPECAFLSGGQSSLLLDVSFTNSKAIDIPPEFGLSQNMECHDWS
jgi:hypothetical protein